MVINTVCVSKNNVDPKQQILVNVADVDTIAEDTNTPVDYDTLTVAEKATFDACMVMLESKIPV